MKKKSLITWKIPEPPSLDMGTMLNPVPTRIPMTLVFPICKGLLLDECRQSPPPSFNPNKPPKANKGEPEFTAVDNPGNWSKYTFQAQFNRQGKYTCHALPTGATPVPVDGKGKRTWKDWEFHYNGWYGPDDVPYRLGATRSNPFPAARKGCIDKVKLAKLGLTKERMNVGDGRPDALFFYQLILPMCDPKQSGVQGDGR
jgi:hypothetical protein